MLKDGMLMVGNLETQNSISLKIKKNLLTDFN